MNRRGFLRTLGLGVAAMAIAPVLPKIVTVTPSAPLFIPSQNLDLGVPRRILTATEMPKVATYYVEGEQGLWPGFPRQDVPMLLVNDEFNTTYARQNGGNPKIKAGSTLMVDEQTASRWIRRGVGVPAPSASAEMQGAYASRRLEKEQAAEKQRADEAYWQSGDWMQDGKHEDGYPESPAPAPNGLAGWLPIVRRPPDAESVVMNTMLREWDG